jgi:hypothetical protein
LGDRAGARCGTAAGDGALESTAEKKPRIKRANSQVFLEERIYGDKTAPPDLIAKQEQTVEEVGNPHSQFEEGQFTGEEVLERLFGDRPQKKGRAQNTDIKTIEQGKEGFPGFRPAEESLKIADEIALVVRGLYRTDIIPHCPEQ